MMIFFFYKFVFSSFARFSSINDYILNLPEYYESDSEYDSGDETRDNSKDNTLIIYDIDKCDKSEFSDKESRLLIFFDYCIFANTIIRDVKLHYSQKTTETFEKSELFKIILISLNTCIHLKNIEFDGD